MREAAQGCAFVRLFLSAGQRFLSRFVVAQEPGGRFGKGPLEGRVADLLAGGAHMCAARCLAAFDQAARGSTLLDAGDAVESMDVIAQHEAEDLAKARYGLSQREGMGLVRLGGVDDGKLQSTEPLVIIRHQGEIDRDVLLHGGIRQALSHASAVGFVRALLADRGQVVLAVRMLDRGQEGGASAHEVRPAPQEVTGGAPLSWRARGRRAQAATKQYGNLLRIDFVVFRRATVEGFPGEGMAEDAGTAFAGPAVGQPVPGKDTFDSEDEIVPIRRKGLAQGLWTGWHVAVPHELTVLVQETDVQTAGVEVDATIRVMLFGVKSHEGSSSFVKGAFPNASILPEYAEGEASIIIKALQAMRYRARLSASVSRTSI